MPRADTKTVLAADGEYRIEHFYENVALVWRGGSADIGDHYGDPTCAVINSSAGWCVTGGEGLVICHFEGGLPRGPGRVSSKRLKMLELWRRGNPPPQSAFWSVQGAWLYQDDAVRVVVDPSSEHAGLYEINVTTLAWRKI
jgi:hypothetical protein